MAEAPSRKSLVGLARSPAALLCRNWATLLAAMLVQFARRGATLMLKVCSDLISEHSIPLCLPQDPGFAMRGLPVSSSQQLGFDHRHLKMPSGDRPG